jgi:hypothetical protein
MTTDGSERRTLTEANTKAAALREAYERLGRLLLRPHVTDEVRIEIQLAQDAVRRGMEM